MKFFLIASLIWFSNFIFSQSKTEQFLFAIEKDNIQQAELIAKSDSVLQKITNSKLVYLKTGTIDYSGLDSLDYRALENEKKTLYNLYVGELLEISSRKFSDNAYKNFVQALNIAKKSELLTVQKHCYIKIIVSLLHSINEQDFWHKVKEFQAIAHDSHSIFWLNYCTMQFKLKKKMQNPANDFNVQAELKILYKYQHYNKLFPILYGNAIAMYNQFILQNNVKSTEKYTQIIHQANQYKYYYLHRFSDQFSINKAYTCIENKDYTQAKSLLRKAKQSHSIQNNYSGLITLYNNYVLLYTKTNNKDSIIFYTNKIDEVEQKQKELEFSISTFEINLKNKINEKNQEISTLKKLHMNYENYKLLYIIGLSIVFLLALYSFIRWKKVDYNRRKLAKEKQELEVEHTQTIQQLEQVKQLVIEDHIVLKNKSRIYLNELIYIKSDDHYLALYTTGKKEFVRGSIQEILKELPPNFAQSHRSYIVNTNFVLHSRDANTLILKDNTEIPVSRNYKKNFTS